MAVFGHSVQHQLHLVDAIPIHIRTVRTHPTRLLAFGTAAEILQAATGTQIPMVPGCQQYGQGAEGQDGLAVAVLAKDERGLEAVHKSRVAASGSPSTPRYSQRAGGHGQHGPVNALQPRGHTDGEYGTPRMRRCPGGVPCRAATGAWPQRYGSCRSGAWLRLEAQPEGCRPARGGARSYGTGGSGSASKVVHGAQQILAQVKTPRVEDKVVGAGGMASWK